MNETEIAIMSGLAALRRAGVRMVSVEVTKLEELYSENARLREALEDAAIMLRLFETGQKP
jgi:hypothetical protein